jgi:hypothetical protein
MVRHTLQHLQDGDFSPQLKLELILTRSGTWLTYLYSFLEQWTGENGLDKRSGLYGPSFLASETGDFVQIDDCYFRHGSIENYKHVNAFEDAATGSLGMEMGESVARGRWVSLSLPSLC